MTVIWRRNCLKLKLLTIYFVTLVTCSAFFLLGLSNAYGAELYSKNDKPFGTSLDGWMDRWWTWWITTDTDESTPEPYGCIINKNNSMVMLMDTTVPGKPHQKCEISSRQGIIVPLWTGEWEASVVEDRNKTYQELSKMARENLDLGVITSLVKLDGIPVANLDVVSKIPGVTINRMDNVIELYSKGFNITIPEDTHYADMNIGTWPAGAHGWFVFLKPLEPGDHKIEYNIGVVEGENKHASEITYDLKVNKQ